MAQSDSFIPIISDIAHFIKPNVRLMFVPDMGHTMFDADLKQSDAQVVAWEAEDEPLKDIFRAGIDLHAQNAKDIYRLQREPTPHERQMAKHGVHATDFLSSPYNMAKKLDMTIHQAEGFQKRWFYLHPGIPKWHKRVEMELMATRTVTNAFGYRRIFFERIDKILPEAIAWVPQSTTVNVIDKGMLNIARNLPDIQLLLQVHDSAIGQFKHALYPTIRKEIHKQMLIPIPYDDPLTIGVDIACSRNSWGACKKVPIDDGKLICPY
jgi:DNA polymerase I-like protein with 3'-5' exonuclease and polymerase domains